MTKRSTARSRQPRGACGVRGWARSSRCRTTGSMLDTVDRSGDVDRIWVHYSWLIGGHMGDLRLTVPGGDPANSGSAVRPAGLLKKPYLPLLLELDTQWNTRPVVFDWREDIYNSGAPSRRRGESIRRGRTSASRGALDGWSLGRPERGLALTFSQMWKSMAYVTSSERAAGW